MKRVVRSKNGREVYGPKWQNNETDISEVEDDDGALVPSAQVFDTEMLPPDTEPTIVNDQNKIFKGIDRRGTRISDRHQSMYRAALEGDCVAAEMLLEEDPNLACDEISEEGDRALHIAASMNHQQLVQKLVERMGPSDLASLDGRGYTACCYAAILGAIDIAELMIRKNPTLATVRDQENKTPLLKAALRGNADMVSYFLRSAKTEDLSTDEWFNILLVNIRRRMYGVALILSRIIERLATMTKDEETALHVLARQVLFVRSLKIQVLPTRKGVMPPDMQLLAKNLWEGMQRLGQEKVLELLKNPNILHDAAEVGNVELITMITHTYPDLVWQTNKDGHTIFHIAVKHRHVTLFQLINEIGAQKDLIAISQDRNGNNILHLAALLAPTDNKMIPRNAVSRMRTGTKLFENVKAIVPPFCLEMKNNEGYEPRELFSKMQKSLLNESLTWVRNTADSCILISTLIFTVAIGSAFAMPGGYNQETGIPVLLDHFWFILFILFEGVAVLSSAFSMLIFWLISMSNVEEDQFLEILLKLFEYALVLLFISIVSAISAFVSAYSLLFGRTNSTILIGFIVCTYTLIFSVLRSLLSLFDVPEVRILFRERNRLTLLKRHALTAPGNKRRYWIF